METAFQMFVVIFGIGAVIWTPVFLKWRERMRLIDLVRSASERGEPLPPELVSTLMTEPRPARPSHVRDVRRGIILVSGALAIEIIALCVYSAIALAGEIEQAGPVGLGIAGFGAIPGCIGLAFLLLGMTARKPEDA